ncbi:hypothetical protein POZ24_11215 [Bacteroides uniformis]|jgi:hypothetical protein|uniref:DUF1189 domain-containing protein n=2 Tax=Bacteroides uniformis TaxID=820 RepID=A0AAW6GP05_BACUN|nr:hypothetical protein [Bacteroides uniformis]RGZ62903.1 hypothetical protein DW980_15195 [Bacteroides stercoris]MDC1831676.1 hypothetical protein [Bacteroides uniformis]MDC1880595.1 hypothetical protein [Bacteroides uniformis]MDC1885082.1 hypothetical protein [Bacteroides uniformis]RHE34287.1 hypothetical protein DW749_13395 [Bacteroides uniformis]
MEELIRKFINFFESDRISVSRKIAIPLLMLLVVLALDNILGISYYWINKIEIDYIVKVEEAKAVCESDSIILFHLDDKIEKAINRKNIFQWFASLFENANIEKNTEVNITNSDGNILSVIGKWFPEVERNQMWHTVTSSLLWVILFAILLLFLIFAPFVVEKDKVATIIGVIFGLGILAFLIWITQWIFGLIPVILNRAYINYALQLGLNLVPIMALTIGSIKEAKKKKLT